MSTTDERADRGDQIIGMIHQICEGLPRLRGQRALAEKERVALAELRAQIARALGEDTPVSAADAQEGPQAPTPNVPCTDPDCHCVAQRDAYETLTMFFVRLGTEVDQTNPRLGRRFHAFLAEFEHVRKVEAQLHRSWHAHRAWTAWYIANAPLPAVPRAPKPRTTPVERDERRRLGYMIEGAATHVFGQTADPAQRAASLRKMLLATAADAEALRGWSLVCHLRRVQRGTDLRAAMKSHYGAVYEPLVRAEATARAAVVEATVTRLHKLSKDELVGDCRRSTVVPLVCNLLDVPPHHAVPGPQVVGETAGGTGCARRPRRPAHCTPRLEPAGPGGRRAPPGRPQGTARGAPAAATVGDPRDLGARPPAHAPNATGATNTGLSTRSPGVPAPRCAHEPTGILVFWPPAQQDACCEPWRPLGALAVRVGASTSTLFRSFVWLATIFRVADLKFPLIENALDSIAAAIDDWNAFKENGSKRHLKRAVRDLWQGVELVLKARLHAEHWSLVFADVNKANATRYEIGNFTSVNFATCVERLTGICGLRIDSSQLEALQSMRNRVEHFEIETTYPAVAVAAAPALNFVVEFISANLAPARLSSDAAALWKQISRERLGVEEYVRHRLDGIDSDLAAVKTLLVMCPECHVERDTLLVEQATFRCLFCGYAAAHDRPEFAAEAYVHQVFGGFDDNYEGSHRHVLRCPRCTTRTIVYVGAGYACFSCYENFPAASFILCRYCALNPRRIPRLFYDVDGFPVCPECREVVPDFRTATLPQQRVD